ncbi:CoB--CoM heterodisulfide reductase subunit B [Desulfocucumis palustris]|uniref:CoB--CoM heterodisulfide reductase subunit B n=1 Tax=Desulfocucumis palustris TaxID=1898651 RepID=A0A2L2XFL8_9FIRM|nr:CoB--CoM heterodisulfide reductase iron-sulfur subunit B family protein [Desulfocucumis palustris]GBF34493.1 CoB--CoM heterodisulfide reductase subunit B [Desulfocucumis palustris]
MRYSVYPGCSLEATALSYMKSLEPVAEALGMHLEEIPDWNCCGASVASGVVGDFAQQVMTARNLALAEEKGLDILVACSSCYMNMGLTNKRFKDDAHFAKLANEALAVGGLKYNGTLRVRQIVDALVNDIGLDKIKARVKRPLTGLKVAGYVGCQTVRALPWEYDDPERPVLLDQLVEALGATAVPFPMKARCCGSSHAIAQTEIVLDCSREILESARSNGASMMVTPCPMCQLNIDAYQGMINKTYNTNYAIPTLFITQLMAIAFDLPPEASALKYCIVSPYEALAPLGVGK